MNFNRRSVIASFCVLLVGCYPDPLVEAPTPSTPIAVSSEPSVHDTAPPNGSAPDRIAQKAANFLWAQQSDDGAWRSETYGLLGSGQSLTPFVLHSLLTASAAEPPGGAIDKALEFLRSRINEQGVLGVHDPDILDYPNYSTAFALMCFKQTARKRDVPLVERIEQYLIEQQFCEANGFDETSPAYGGWGFGGSHAPGETGHMDLAHTRCVLQALAMQPVHEKCWADVQNRSLRFLSLVQKHPDETRLQPLPDESSIPCDSIAAFDGGFYFSPIVLRANKGRLDKSGSTACWRSYATATCDGLMALLSAGVPPNDVRVSKAINWLAKHQELKYPEGIPELYQGENWREAVFFYHLAVRGESARQLNLDSSMRDRIAEQISELQNADGRFQNRESSLMKEDDPILCTALVLNALAK